jgi:hypothetical protein
MSNAIATVPAHIAARIAARQSAGTAKSAITQAVVGDALAIPRISIKASRYRLVEDGVETPIGIALDAIIVGANPKVSKVFYAKQYDSSADNVQPDCLSTNGIKPEDWIKNPVHTDCATCPHNVLGSKINPGGAKSKLCADQRHLAVVPAADPSKVYNLTIPVSAMKAMREYFKELDNYGIGPEEVVTELGFDDQASFPKITFKQKGYVGANALKRVDELVNSDAVKVATRQIPPTGMGKPALAAPASQQALTSSAPAAAPAAPAVDDAYEDEAAAQPAAAPAPAPAAAPAAAKVRPVVAPVTASAELAAKVDALFD